MLSLEVKNLFQSQFKERVKFDEPLAPYVAYQIGGPADILVFPKSEEDLTFLSEVSKKFALPITIIGTGTNLLVHDAGIRGVTVSLLHSFNTIEYTKAPLDALWVKAGGGVSKPDFLEWALQNELTGLEFSAGVPGTVGGGIFMNAGTKYGSYGDILKELRVFDFLRGAQTLSRDELHFGYREQNAVKDSLVISATFELKKGDATAARTEVERIIQERALKQPLDYPSCGSTFKNPEGFSAGRLIEKAGLKGLKRGGAEISLKHANFILNKGGAKAQDILELIDTVKLEVFKQFGVRLECEVIVLGQTNETPKISHSHSI